MVDAVNKFLTVLVKFFVLISFSVIVSCSFSNTAKPLPDAETADTGDTVADTGDTVADTGDTVADTGDTVADTGDTVADTDDIPEEEKIKSVVIATYNTHLFFDKECDSGSCSSSDFESVPSDEEYDEKVRELAGSIKEIDADIILLQEIEKKSCLEDLFKKTGGYDDFYLGEKGYNASVDTGVMTKGRIISGNRHTEKIDCSECEGGTTTFTRAFLETHIELGGREIIVFSAHFKSKNDDDAPRRLAEAAAAAKILRETAKEHPEALIVMGGDLNDEPGSDTLEPFESDETFLRVAGELSSKDQATYSYHGEAVALDHIFWVKTDFGSYEKGSAEVVKDAPSLYSLGSSDHAALKATFGF